MVNRFQQPNLFKKHLDIFFFSQNRCRSKPYLSGLHAFRIKGIICFNLQRISPTKVFSLEIFKLFRFKGKTMTNFRKLLPNWPISWRFSGLLILREIFWKKQVRFLLSFRYFRFKGKTGNNFLKLTP